MGDPIVALLGALHREFTPAPTEGTIVDFIEATGRLPLVGQGEKPWHFRGWLGWYVQRLHEHPDFPFPDRWGYLQRVQQGIDPGPIPRVEFTNAYGGEALKHIGKCVTIAGEDGARGWGWTSLRLFVEWLGYGLGHEATMPDLSDAVQERLYRTFNAEIILRNPGDHLGTYICEQRGGGWNPNAFYPTPHAVCEAMATMQMHELDGDRRFKSVLDCCVGTGRMLLHASNHSLRLYGQDIDRLMVAITKINGAFYAPWIVASGAVPDAPDALVPPPPARRRRGR